MLDRETNIEELSKSGPRIEIQKEKQLFLLTMDVITETRTELRCYVSWMGEDGIARTVVKEDAEIVLEDAVANSKCINALPGPAQFALLVDARPVKSISKEARDHFSMRGRESRVIGFAILIDSPVSTIIGNFFMGLNKPRVPMRLFTDEQKAVDWCKKRSHKVVGT